MLQLLEQLRATAQPLVLEGGHTLGGCRGREVCITSHFGGLPAPIKQRSDYSMPSQCLGFNICYGLCPWVATCSAALLGVPAMLRRPGAAYH